jgi:hypothetical protein
MGRSSKASREDAAILRRLAAEDAAFKFLTENFSAATSIAIARRLEWRLAQRLAEEQCDLLKQRHQRTVFGIEPHELDAARKACASILPEKSDPGAEQHVLGLFSELLPDEAWLVAKKVRDAVEHWWRGKPGTALTMNPRHE